MSPEYPWDYPRSNARAYLDGRDDILVRVKPLLDMVEDWQYFIGWETTNEMIEVIQRHERTGRPSGDEAFIEHIEASTGRELKRKKPGSPKKTGNDGTY